MSIKLQSEADRVPSRMDLLELGLRVLDDHTLAPVFGDAVLESGWWDQRVKCLQSRRLNGHQRWIKLFWISYRENGWPSSFEMDPGFQATEVRAHQRMHASRSPTVRWVRACVAVLMFGDWTTKRWLDDRFSIGRLVSHEGMTYFEVGDRITVESNDGLRATTTVTSVGRDNGLIWSDGREPGVERTQEIRLAKKQGGFFAPSALRSHKRR